MDQLKEMIIARTGIDAETADKVVDAVVDFIKENPEKLTGFLGGEGGPLGKLKGLLG